MEKGPATLDTSEICSPEATVVKSYDPAKSGILCARRGGQTRLPCFRLSLHYILTPLGGASSRALVATPSFSRPKWLRYAPVCATQRRPYLVSDRLDCVVVLTTEKSVELR